MKFMLDFLKDKWDLRGISGREEVVGKSNIEGLGEGSDFWEPKMQIVGR